MNNIITYVEKEMDKLNIDNFNTVDSLILSCFSYYSLPDITKTFDENKMSDLYKLEYFENMFLNLWDPDSYKKLFSLLCASPRYRDIYVQNFVSEINFDEEKQFSAVSLKISEDLYYISFRGTNATFVGWKEDFNMSFKCPVPAQKSAAKYLNEIAKKTKAKFILGGHSKGGNLAIYAALDCDEEIKDRIIQIYSHDGPGFFEDIIESENYKKIYDRINKTIPQSSIVGLLLEQKEELNIVNSSRNSVFQHDPFSWEVLEKDFVKVDNLTKDSIIIDKALKNWLKEISPKERYNFVEILYEILNTNNLYSFEELKSDLPNNIKTIVKKAYNTDKKSKKIVLNVIKTMISSGVKAIFEE